MSGYRWFISRTSIGPPATSGSTIRRPLNDLNTTYCGMNRGLTEPGGQGGTSSPPEQARRVPSRLEFAQSRLHDNPLRPNLCGRPIGLTLNPWNLNRPKSPTRPAPCYMTHNHARTALGGLPYSLAICFTDLPILMSMLGQGDAVPARRSLCELARCGRSDPSRYHRRYWSRNHHWRRDGEVVGTLPTRLPAVRRGVRP